MKKFFYLFLLLFSFLGVVFIPFSFHSFGFQAKITQFLFEDLILFVGSCFDKIQVINSEISSDSTTFYLLLGILFVISIPLTFLLSYFKSFKKYQHLTVVLIQLILTYYLSLVLLRYGFDKIFKSQFYLPEPNTLYTPLGFLDKDILYWSTMGSSYSYTVFMGVLEIIPALLLLFRRTRVLGLIVLSGVLLNVVFINFGFDISVKLYSIFLLLLCILLLVPSFTAIISFFILNKRVELPKISGKDVITSKSIRSLVKTIVVLFIFTESLLPYFQSGNFNDDIVPRSEFHGAYEIIKIESQQTDQSAFGKNVKRLFIHRHGYLILQYEDDTMEDFYIEIVPSSNEFILTNYDGEQIHVFYDYSKENSTLELNFSELKLVIYTKALPWKEMPLLQPLFHWTVDEIK